MNAIAKALAKTNELVTAAISGNKTTEDIKAELMKLTKTELVDLLAANMKAQNVSIESVVKTILETEECSWLTYEQIATVICRHVPGAKTSSKSIASYASKYPKEKNWKVVPRKRTAEITAEMLKLVNQ